MRGVIVAILVVVVGTIATIVLERFMDNAPEWIWRLAYSVVGVGGLSILLLSDPVFGILSDFRRHPILSTCFITASVALVAAIVWIFWIMGFPTSKAWRSARSGPKVEPTATASPISRAQIPPLYPKLVVDSMTSERCKFHLQVKNGWATVENVAWNWATDEFYKLEKPNMVDPEKQKMIAPEGELSLPGSELPLRTGKDHTLSATVYYDANVNGVERHFIGRFDFPFQLSNPNFSQADPKRTSFQEGERPDADDIAADGALAFSNMRGVLVWNFDENDPLLLMAPAARRMITYLMVKRTVTFKFPVSEDTAIPRKEFEAPMANTPDGMHTIVVGWSEYGGFLTVDHGETQSYFSTPPSPTPDTEASPR